MTRPTAAPEPVNCSTNQEQGDDGELVPEICDAQPQAKAAGTRDRAMERQQQSCHHFLLLCTFARVTAGDFLFNLI
jgi:hypothetical protein